MLLNEHALKKLNELAKHDEVSKSSHWTNFLVDFDFSNGQFIGNYLPEGMGSPATSRVKSFGHYLFQYPYRRMGKQFSAFSAILKNAREIHRSRNTLMNVGTLRQVLSLSMLDFHLDLHSIHDPIVVIGDGFGLMSTLLLKHLKIQHSKIIIVNLTSMLLADSFCLKNVLPDENIVLVQSEQEYCQAIDNDKCRVILVQADNSHFLLERGVGLAINIVSMQEMNPDIIEQYFDYLRGSKSDETWFYCNNRLNKTLPDGVEVNFMDYPWDIDDEIIVDELCPWSQYYYNMRPFFYHKYDGPIQHRLVKLKKC